ncbi:MAG: NADH-quinone oxidoreductase subunit C [Pseudohongiellaceae bacterium]|jgi:NADH-quinone oxidoreductase subunit C
MNETAIYQGLLASGIAGVGELDESSKDPTIVVEASALVETMTWLRDDAGCAMEMLHLVTAIEWPDRMDMVYHVSSLEKHHAITVRVSLDRPEGADFTPEVPSVASVYGSADWHEREQWDLLGVRFTNHPDHRRILLPEEWIGHPLRKDYVYPSEHGGIPLELDAVPLYERADSTEAAAPVSEPRPAGSPLVQPPMEPSTRPDAGGKAPDKKKDQS